MATYSWLGTTATWSTATNWMTGGLPAGSAPGTTDDCVFDGSGGGSSSAAVTLTASTTVSSVDFTSYTGTFTHNSAQVLTISGGGASNKLTFVAGMTYTKGNATTSSLSFTATTGTTLITFAGASGKIPGNMTFGTGGVTGGAYQFQDTVPANATTTQVFTVAGGTLDLNTQTVNVGTLTVNSGTATRTVSGSGATINIKATSGTPLDFTTGTGFASGFTGLSAATINVPGATGSMSPQFGTSNSFGTVNLTAGAFPLTLGAATALTIATLSIPAGTRVRFQNGITTTISNAFNWIGTMASQIDLHSSSGVGATSTVSVAASSAISWAAIADLIFSGNAITASNSFNLGNNSGITINPPGITAGRLLGGFLE